MDDKIPKITLLPCSNIVIISSCKTKIRAFGMEIEFLHIQFITVTMERMEKSHSLTIFHC